MTTKHMLIMKLKSAFSFKTQIKITGSWSILSLIKIKGSHLMYSKIQRLKIQALRRKKRKKKMFLDISWFQRLFVTLGFTSTKCQGLDLTLLSNLNTGLASQFPHMMQVSKTITKSKKRGQHKNWKSKNGKNSSLKNKMLPLKVVERVSIRKKKSGQRSIQLIF